MDRRSWLDERRAATRSAYDADASRYDEDEYQGVAHRRFVARLLETCPAAGLILDAPCGTGRYFAQVAETGRRVVGIDQSAGMLAEARARGIAESLEQVGLQELAFEHAFDAVMTVDAMENVGPEDWPLVLANLHRAVRPGGHLYLTVEEQGDALIDATFASLSARGLPVVRGEVIDEEEAAGYHYYPDREQVVAWVAAEGLQIVDEAYEAGPDGGWGYRHFLAHDVEPSA
jgi:SAM-dependent methyltransferase